MSYLHSVKQSSVWSRQLTALQVIVICVMSLLATLVLVLSLLLMRLSHRSLILQSKTFQSQTGFLLNLLTQEQLRTSSLTNLLTSKDAMTYAALQAQTLTPSLTSEFVTPVGTDIDELARYNATYGIEPVDDDLAREFNEQFGLGD